jgi:AmmeMemoRadiSam system protein A
MSKLLLDIAKAAILGEFDKTVKINENELLEKYPMLQELRATFVTLTINGRLRGCIGSIIAHRTLLDDLIHNAKSAAFGDPRFPPLSKEEFSLVSVEISLLTPPVEVHYTDKNDLKVKIQKGIDGIILKSGYHQATFLPQVWESLNDFDDFFSALCQKAGLNGNCLDSKPTIFKYNVEKLK